MANFAENSLTSNWLKRMGVKFEYKEHVRFSELTPNWAVINQGRPDSAPKDERLIERYADAQNQGAVFPAPIIAKTSTGYEILDGTQRLCGAELCGQTVFNAYLVKSDVPSVRASIRICANGVLNGTAPSQDWTISKVVDVLYEQHDFSAADCSMWSGQPVARIELEIQSRDAGRWLRCQNIDTTVKPANQKGFLACLARLAPGTVRPSLVKELPDVVRALQSVKANNNEAEHLLEQILGDLRKDAKGGLANQVRSRLSEVMERPEIRQRMTGPRKNHPIDNALAKMTGAITSLRFAAKGEFHTDDFQSVACLELLAEMRRLCRKIVPRETWKEFAENKEAVA